MKMFATWGRDILLLVLIPILTLGEHVQPAAQLHIRLRTPKMNLVAEMIVDFNY